MKQLAISLLITVFSTLLTAYDAIDMQILLNRQYHDCANYVILTSDECYLIAGWAISKNRSLDGLAVKVGKDGDLFFEKILGSEYEDEFNVALECDGYYFLAGSTFDLNTNYEAWIVKLDKNGQKILERTFGGQKRDEILAGIVTSEKNLLFVGRSTSRGKGETDVYVLKLDLDLNLIWERTFGGFSLDEAYSVLQVNDGYLMVGFSESFSVDEDVYVIKLDFDGNLIFEKSYQFAGLEKVVDVIPTSDGFLMVGFTWDGLSDDADGLMMKIDSSGNLIWKKTFGTKGWEQFNKILRWGKNILLVGFAKNEFTKGYDVYVVKTDEQGNFLGEIYSNIEGSDFAKCAVLADGELITAGWIDSPEPYMWDVLVLKIRF